MAVDGLVQTSQNNNAPNWWMIVAIVELLIIIVLLLRKSVDSSKRKIKRDVMREGNIDYDNIIASSFGAKALYDELIRKCHPDKFAPDQAKMTIANDITERLGESKHDLKKLNELKREAEDRLNISL